MFPLSFQYAGTNFMESLIMLHHDILFFLIIILGTVLWLLFYAVFKYRLVFITTKSPEIIKSFYLSRYFKVDHTFNEEKRAKINYYLELFWTIVPTFFIAIMLIPSFTLLYASDDDINPAFTLKIYGRQWFWTYEYKMENLFNSHIFTNLNPSLFLESTLIQQEDLTVDQFRLLEVNNPVVLPQNTSVRILLTSFDVIHSWSVPALGLKLDAIPGIINQAVLNVNKEGIFYGQCYELCGPFHGFMPITFYSVNFEKFLFWYVLMSKIS